MNIHPIFVHFPIALLATYAILELIRVKKLTDRPEWFYLKLFLLLFGTAAAFITLQTGEIAQHLLSDKSLRQLVSVHSRWAETTTALFILLACGYFVKWMRRFDISFITERTSAVRALWHIALRLQYVITDTPLVILLAFAGLAALTITGGLGGSIVYGPNADFVSSFIYRIFFR